MCCFVENNLILRSVLFFENLFVVEVVYCRCPMLCFVLLLIFILRHAFMKQIQICNN
jgi:hypothetical protein